MAIRYPITLSTTEPNNDVGLLKIRQSDEETQTLVIEITENSVPKSFVGLQPFFCAKLGQSLGLGIVEQKIEGVMNPEKGTLEYVLQPTDWQIVGRQVAYISFRKMNPDHTYTEQFSTRDFYYTVTKSVFSDGIKEISRGGSTYIWTFEDMLRLLQEWVNTSEVDFHDWLGMTKDEFNDWIVDHRKDFNSWFDKIKDTLGNDAAGNLAMAVAAIKDELSPFSESILFEPQNISNDYRADSTGRVLNMTSDEYLALFFNPYVGTTTAGMTVTRNELGLDESGIYPLYEYVFKSEKSRKKILLSSGMHTYELPASFAMGYFIKNLMDPNIKHPGFEYLRSEVEIHVIPIINPWGFNQNPKKYGNSNGVNINRNFDIDGMWSKFPSIPPEENEWNYKGAAPWSEAESRLLRDWATANRDALYWIDCHTGLGVSEGENWIMGHSADSYLTKWKESLAVLEKRIRKVYEKDPRTLLEVDKDSTIRGAWAVEQLGIGSLTIEQSGKGLPWGTNTNNEDSDIKEYLITLVAYVLGGLDISSTNFYTNKVQSDLEGQSTKLNELEAVAKSAKTNELIALENNPIWDQDTFNRADSNALGTTELKAKAWFSRNSQMVIKDNHLMKLPGIFGGIATVDAGRSNCIMEADLNYNGYIGLVGRLDSSGQYINIRLADNSLLVQKANQNGVSSNDKEYFRKHIDLKPGNTYRVTSVLSGNLCDVYIDGNHEASCIVDSDQIDSGIFGIRIARYDDVSYADNIVFRKVMTNISAELTLKNNWTGKLIISRDENGNCNIAGKVKAGSVAEFVQIADVSPSYLPEFGYSGNVYRMSDRKSIAGLFLIDSAAYLQLRAPAYGEIKTGDELMINASYKVY